MATKIVLGVLFIGLMFVPSTGKGTNVPGVTQADINAANRGTLKVDLDFGRFPLYFIANRGQAHEKARFFARASLYTLWLTSEGLVFDSVKRSNKKPETKRNDNSQHSNIPSSHHPGGERQRTKYHRDVSRLLFVGANKNPEMAAVDPARLKVNYFIGRDESKWHCDVPTSMAVLYRNIYRNIDLKVYGIEKQVEYDWVVKPGAVPGNIRFAYKNVKSTRIDKDGSLVVETRFGRWVHKRPVAYQMRQEGNKAIREEVDVCFKKIGKHTYGFAVGEYDRSRTLVIDPVVLVYSTVLTPGTWNSVWATGIAVDNSGYAYVGGRMLSADFPIKDEYQGYQGGNDAFITKIDATQAGSASLVYSTYVGGSYADYGEAIAVDNSGNAYLTGMAFSSNFPFKNGYQSVNNIGDVFLTKINTNLAGAAGLQYSTLLGGDRHDYGYGVAVDDSGNAYVTGMTNSDNFPVKNHYQTHQGSTSYDWDAVVFRIDTTQSGAASLVYSSYLGGSDTDRGNGIAADNSGNAYVVGLTYSSDFPTWDALQSTLSGETDAFITKIDTNQGGALSLAYSTFLGGSQKEVAEDIDLVGSSVYVTGKTESSDFYKVNQYQVNQADYDAFITRIDMGQVGGWTIVYSSYLGGSGEDSGSGVAVDGSGNAYITGNTRSSDFPVKGEFQAYGLSGDAFIARVDTSRVGAASLIYSTFLGANGIEEVNGIGIDPSGNAYVAGRTSGHNFPLVNEYQAPTDASWYAFVSKISYCTADLSILAVRATERAWIIRRDFAKLTLIVDNTCGEPIAKYRIYRKEAAGSYQLLLELSISQFPGNTYSHLDKWLEGGKTYTYKFSALDAADTVLAESNEITI